MGIMTIVVMAARTSTEQLFGRYCCTNTIHLYGDWQILQSVYALHDDCQNWGLNPELSLGSGRRSGDRANSSAYSEVRDAWMDWMPYDR
jgi:hypothetical protein